MFWIFVVEVASVFLLSDSLQVKVASLFLLTHFTKSQNNETNK